MCLVIRTVKCVSIIRNKRGNEKRKIQELYSGTRVSLLLKQAHACLQFNLFNRENKSASVPKW